MYNIAAPSDDTTREVALIVHVDTDGHLSNWLQDSIIKINKRHSIRKHSLFTTTFRSKQPSSPPEEGPSLDRNVVVNKLCFHILWRLFINLDESFISKCVLCSFLNNAKYTNISGKTAILISLLFFVKCIVFSCKSSYKKRQKLFVLFFCNTIVLRSYYDCIKALWDKA